MCFYFGEQWLQLLDILIHNPFIIHSCVATLFSKWEALCQIKIKTPFRKIVFILPCHSLCVDYYLVFKKYSVWTNELVSTSSNLCLMAICTAQSGHLFSSQQSKWIDSVFDMTAFKKRKESFENITGVIYYCIFPNCNYPHKVI